MSKPSKKAYDSCDHNWKLINDHVAHCDKCKWNTTRIEVIEKLKALPQERLRQARRHIDFAKSQRKPNTATLLAVLDELTTYLEEPHE